MEIQYYSLSFTILVFVFTLFWLLKLYKRCKHHSQKLPPGPRKLPVIGNLHNLAGSLPHRVLGELSRKHGPLMHLQLGETSAIVASSPRMASEIMKTHDLCFAQRPELLASKILTFGGIDIVFAPYGDYWRQMRKLCIVELLSAKRVQSFSSIRQEEVSKLIKFIRSSAGTPFNFSEKISNLLCTITSRAAYGNKCKDQEAFTAITRQGVALTGGVDLSDLFPSMKFLHAFSGTKARLEKIKKEGDGYLDDIINDHKGKRSGKGEEGVEDLVDVLLRLEQSGDLEFPVTNDHIKAVLWDVFAAGIDSSTAVESAMAEMMKNPRIMEKAQAEIREAFKGKMSIHDRDLQELTYLKMVLKETMRLHPPAPLLVPRECRESCEIDGYKIPIKTKVVVNAWAIGRDPEYWNDAESFIPERFENSSIDYKGTNFEFIPFGAGRRICPGISFAMANIEFPLAQLLFHFNWKLPGGLMPENLDMEEKFGATVGRKNDLFFIAIPFSPSTDL